MEKNKNDDQNLKRFKSLDGLSIKEMNFGLWLSKNRRIFVHLFIIVLVLISVFFFSYSTYHYFKYFINSDKVNNLEDLNNVLLSSKTNIQKISIGSPLILKSASKHDLVVEVKNNNKKFINRFNYCFEQGSTKIECGKSFVFPEESKYVLSLGKDLPEIGKKVKFIITDSSWQRISAHKIPDWEKFKLDRQLFVSNINFTPASRSGLSERLYLNTLEFNIDNKTPYSYYHVLVNIFLYNGSNIVGVNKYDINNFLSSDQRSVRITWSGILPRVTNIKIIPSIDILDDSVYLQYQG